VFLEISFSTIRLLQLLSHSQGTLEFPLPKTTRCLHDQT